MYLNDFSLAFTIIFLVSWYLLQSIAYLKFFEKAGEQGWIGFIPFYNYYTHLKIVGRPLWWVFMLFVPVVNFFVVPSAVVGATLFWVEQLKGRELEAS